MATDRPTALPPSTLAGFGEARDRSGANLWLAASCSLRKVRRGMIGCSAIFSWHGWWLTARSFSHSPSRLPDFTSRTGADHVSRPRHLKLSFSPSLFFVFLRLASRPSFHTPQHLSLSMGRTAVTSRSATVPCSLAACAFNVAPSDVISTPVIFNFTCNESIWLPVQGPS